MTILTKIQINGFDQPCANINTVENKHTLTYRARQWLDLPMSDKNSKRKEKVNPMIHQGESGSLFGFSVAAHKDQGRGWWATILTSIETFGFFHQHHWWVGFNIFKNKEIISWWSRSVFKRHTYFTSYLASQGSKLELCIKTENRVEHSDLQRGCGLDQKVKRLKRGKMLRDAKQF